MRISRLHGLNVRSPFELGHTTNDGRADLHVSVDSKALADQEEDPSGHTIIRYDTDIPQHALFDCGVDGYVYRIYRIGDFSITADQTVMTCLPLPDVEEELMEVLLGGHILASLVMLQGSLVLHASAVEHDGRAVAFVAQSGGGKSTVAAMVCRAGARVVTDDVLRVEDRTGEITCFRGARALRLRSTSRAVALVDGGSDRVSADGRQLHEPTPTRHDEMPLTGIFLLRLNDAANPQRSRCDTKEAIFQLMPHLRVGGWTDPGTRSRHLDQLASVVERTPTYALDIPWGITDDPARFEELRQLVFESSD